MPKNTLENILISFGFLTLIFIICAAILCIFKGIYKDNDTKCTEVKTMDISKQYPNTNLEKIIILNCKDSLK